MNIFWSLAPFRLDIFFELFQNGRHTVLKWRPHKFLVQTDRTCININENSLILMRVGDLIRISRVVNLQRAGFITIIPSVELTRGIAILNLNKLNKNSLNEKMLE